MSKYLNPFVIDDEKLDNDQLASALRGMIAEEYDAIQLYSQLIEATKNTVVQDSLKEIIREEKIHAGEFTKLLYLVSPQDQILMEKGIRETEETLRIVNG